MRHFVNISPKGIPKRKPHFSMVRMPHRNKKTYFFYGRIFPAEFPVTPPIPLGFSDPPWVTGYHLSNSQSAGLSQDAEECSFVYPLKGLCHQIFWPLFLPWFIPIWAPDKQAKVFSNSVLILPRYSIFLKTLSGVNPTAKSISLRCASFSQLSQHLRCASHR